MKTTLQKKPLLALIFLMAISLSSINVSAQRSIAFVDPMPTATIKEGESQVLTFKYTTTAAESVYQIRFVRKDMASPWAEAPLADGVTVTGVAAAPEGATATVSFTVPTDALSKYPLGENQVYMYIASLFTVTDGQWVEYIDSTSQVTITSNLATNSFNKLGSNVLAQNPVGNELILNNNNFKSASIFDLSGRKVMQFNTVENNIEVSQLTKGIYFLISDTNIKAKFLKK